MSDFKKSGLVQYILIDLRSSLWFAPALIILGMAALALGLVELDQFLGDGLHRRWPQLLALEAETARSMLSTIATSMATVAGVAFSVTVVALTLASTQYTSRVLRKFMRDRANQSVLGILIGVYIYCLLVLRTISGVNGAFVPGLAILGALVLAIIACGAFIFFIHHISTSIQSSDMAEAITRETLDIIDALCPKTSTDDGRPARQLTVPQDLTWQPVPATSMGYIQTVDLNALREIATSRDTIVRMERGIGDFAAQDRPLVSIDLPEAVDDELIHAINRQYAIDIYRTIEQDPAFGIRQLVDMALKALSPSINDTTTAVTCIEHLSVILTRCAQRWTPDPFHFEGDRLRLIVCRPDFSQLAHLAFSQILENAEGNTEIMLQMLNAIEQIAGAVRCTDDMPVLQRRIDTIEEVAMRSAKSVQAQEDLEETLQRVRAALKSRLDTLRNATA